ncbi:voltage-dependent calcium channel subunit alpha-2/delta-3-like [Thrips palmi]|uniref:Voltage-dependent calcium channel subunit alpha-2/delta-3-like n=1 Tax=Thrips palmi TaxID=161013 RepID=A0A6P8ZTM7_THRPL|nr:voltage-dependent calcium channel subunit alpha-2/delta-3-like [Thrips palmi]
MLGKELADMARSVTRFDRLQESIKKMNVEVRDPERVLNEVARNMERLMQRRVNQVQKIRKAAEELGRVDYRQFEVPRFYPGVKDLETTPEPTPPPPPKPKRRRNSLTTAGPPTTAKPTTTVKPWLVHVDTFPGTSLVNVSLSAVHVPTEVDDGSTIDLAEDPEQFNSTGAEVQQIIELTEALDEAFVSNMKEDWSTAWQFFAHHTGVMRQYPASKWNRMYSEDYFDARLRPWYLRAATSPKDIIILLDNSGSIYMTEPALLTKLVAHTILDTLTPDDFVTVLLYSNNVTSLLPGLDDKLIPATSAYVRELQFALEGVNPKGAANLTLALDFSFRLLEKYRLEATGANCNQAIMLVTDLVPEHEEEIFKLYNRPDRASPRHTNVRVFTFTVTDGAQSAPREAQWMACANMGWHEKFWKSATPMTALKYIPVMARPMVLQGAHPVHWSHMYPDVTVPETTDQLWVAMQRDEQLRRLTLVCFKHDEVHRGARKHYQLDRTVPEKELGQSEEYVVTVSVPVFNLSSAGVAEGALLGVAGIDVPVSQLTAFISPHRVGVNAYIFMVSNNGLVIFHPDLRPRFNGILKPGFNSLDMSEVEQEDVPDPRNLSQAMQNFRDQVVKQYKGSVVLSVRQTYRNWRRVARMARRYYFQGVDNTPYSLVMATPLEYGTECVKGSHDSSLTSAKLLSLLGSEWGPHGGWEVHPNWTYCGCCGQPGRLGLERLSLRGQNCDRELVNALAMDADVTKFFSERIKDTSVWERWDVSSAFVATHSGLTRWTSRPINTVVDSETVKSPVPPRGPDEPWFKRAVSSAWAVVAAESDKAGKRGAQPGAAPHWVVTVPMQDEAESDVYSEYTAAYDADDPWAARRAGLADGWNGEEKPNTTDFEKVELLGEQLASITAALFRGKAPAAVVGANFPLTMLQQLFDEITAKTRLEMTVSMGELDLYLLDENAIVVADKTGLNAGRPLTLVNGNLTARLEAAHIFERVTVTDVQGVCRRPKKSSAAALSPSLSASMLGTAALTALWWTGTPGDVAHPFIAHPLYVCTAAMLLGAAKAKDASPKVKAQAFRVNKTTLQLCDIKLHLHRVGAGLHQHHRGQVQLGCDSKNGTARPGVRPFVVAAVPGTNLVLVAALNSCPAVEQFEPFRTTPWEDATPEGSPIYRKMGAQWPRRRPGDCYRRDDGERNIPHCGGAVRVQVGKDLFGV